MGRTYAIVAFIASLIIASPAIAIGPTLNIPIVWDPVPERTTYNIYKSEIAGQFPSTPFDKITRDPIDTNPLYLKLPVISGSRTVYIGVEAQNAEDKSGIGEYIEINMKFDWQNHHMQEE